MAYTPKNPRFESTILTDQSAASVPNPASGSHKMVDRNGILYMRDSAGAETLVGQGLSGPSQALNYGLVTSVAASALTIALKTLAGTDPASLDPVSMAMRSATSTSGIYILRSVTSALSLTVASGATLGHFSGNACYAYIYLIDNAGTLELAISSKKFDDKSIVSTTVMNSSADDASTMYSTTARTNVACKLIGRISSNQTVVGTWAANALEISLGGSFATGGIYGSTDGIFPVGVSGELLQVNSASAAIPNVATSLASLTLPLGRWRMTAIAGGSSALATSTTSLQLGISLVANSFSGCVYGVNLIAATAAGAAQSCSVILPNYYVDVPAAGATYYIVAQSQVALPATQACYRLTAERV